MNFTKHAEFNRPRLMQSGDLVVVYERHDCLSHLYLETDEIFQNKFGKFPHNDIIGKPFGSKIYSKPGPGWVYFLEPSPELWASALNVIIVLLLSTYQLIFHFIDSYTNRKRTGLEYSHLQP